MIKIMNTGAQLGILLGGGMMEKRFYRGQAFLREGHASPLIRLGGALPPPLVARLKMFNLSSFRDNREREKIFEKA